MGDGTDNPAGEPRGHQSEVSLNQRAAAADRRDRTCSKQLPAQPEGTPVKEEKDAPPLKKEHGQRRDARTMQVYLVAASRMMCYLARAQMGALLPFLTQELSLTSVDRGQLMSSYATGYVLTQIPGGILADKFGAYVVVAVVILATAVFSAAAPLAANSGTGAFALPFTLMGLFQGAVMPAGNVLMARWVLPSERSWASAITGIGACLGTLVINFCAAPIASVWGWRAVFCATSAGCMVLLVLWLWAGVSSPDQCLNLSEEEFTLLQQAGLATARPDTAAGEVTPKLASRLGDPKGETDFCKKQRMFDPRLFLHAAVWTVILSHFVQNCQASFADWLPFFFSSQIGMSPDAASFHLTIIASVEIPARFFTKDMPERLEQQGFPLLQCRKIMSMQGFAYYIVLCGLLTLLLGLDVKWPLAYTLLFTLSKAVQAFHSGGYFANYMDLTRNYAGMLTGIGNTLASCAGIIIPHFIAHSLQRDERNWIPVFTGMIFLSCLALAMVSKCMSTNCLDDALTATKVGPHVVVDSKK